MVQGGTWSTLRLPGVWVSALVFFFLPACAGGDDSAGSPSSTGDVSAETSTTTAGQASTTTSSAVPVAGLPADAPPLENTGDDYEAIYRSLIGFVNWLARNPDPDLVELVYYPRGPQHEQQVAAARRSAAEGLRFQGQLEAVDSVELRGERRSGTFDLVATISFPQASIVDSQGSLQRERPARAPQRHLVTLIRSSDGRWRIGDSVELL